MKRELLTEYLENFTISIYSKSFSYFNKFHNLLAAIAKLVYVSINAQNHQRIVGEY